MFCMLTIWFLFEGDFLKGLIYQKVIQTLIFIIIDINEVQSQKWNCIFSTMKYNKFYSTQNYTSIWSKFHLIP